LARQDQAPERASDSLCNAAKKILMNGAACENSALA